MLKISSLKKLVTDSMAIDLGTASTIIAVKGRGVVLDEPSLVAINEITEEIVAFGQEAADMTGREGRDVVVRAPLIGGVVGDFERTKKMLAHFVKKAKTGGSNISLQAVMSMVSDVTHVEQRALLQCRRRGRHRQGVHDGRGPRRRVRRWRRCRPTSVRRRSSISAPGRPTSRSSQKVPVVHSTSDRYRQQRDKRECSRRTFAAIAACRSARKRPKMLKTTFASTFLPDDISKTIEVRGRDVQTGSPAAVEITAGEVYPIVESIVRRIAVSGQGHTDRASPRGCRRHLRPRRHPDRRRSTARRHRPVHASLHQPCRHGRPTNLVMPRSTAW